jgi:hypothetical protein
VFVTIYRPSEGVSPGGHKCSDLRKVPVLAVRPRSSRGASGRTRAQRRADPAPKPGKSDTTALAVTPSGWVGHSIQGWRVHGRPRGRLRRAREWDCPVGRVPSEAKVPTRNLVRAISESGLEQTAERAAVHTRLHVHLCLPKPLRVPGAAGPLRTGPALSPWDSDSSGGVRRGLVSTRKQGPRGSSAHFYPDGVALPITVIAHPADTRKSRNDAGSRPWIERLEWLSSALGRRRRPALRQCFRWYRSCGGCPGRSGA